MILFHTCVIIVLTTAQIVSSKIENYEAEVRALFTDMESKRIPLHKCKGTLNGWKYRVPQVMNCDVESGGPNKEVTITLFWPDISAQVFTGYECFGIRSTQENTQYFFGSKVDSDVHEEKLSINNEDCWSMVTRRRSPKGDEIEMISKGFFGTKLELVKEYWWPHTTTTKVENYYFHILDVSVYELNKAIRTAASTTSDCLYLQDQCATTRGVLVWKSENISTCRLLEGATASCLLTNTEGGQRVSCPAITLSLTNLQSKFICDENFQVSEQGVLFGQTDIGSFDNTTVLADVIRKKIPKSSTVKGRFKRQAAPRMMSDAQINAQMQFIHDSIKTGTSYLIHKHVCENERRDLEILRFFTAAGYASLIPAVLLQDPTYRAMLSGDVLTVWKCDQIYHYMLNDRTECILEWPVTYQQNYKTEVGYISPVSHSIVDKPTKVKCDLLPDFYFDTGAYVVQLNNQTLMKNIPVLPLPGDVSSANALPPLAFRTPGVYSLDELTGRESFFQMIQGLKSERNVEDLIDLQSRSLPVRHNFERTKQALRDVVFEPLYGWLRLGMWLLVIIILVIVARIMWRCRRNIFIRRLINCRINLKPSLPPRKARAPPDYNDVV